MRKSVVFFALLSMVLTVASAQSVDDIIKQMEKARGKIGDLKLTPYFIETSAESAISSMNMTMSNWFVNQKKFRVELKSSFSTTTIAIDDNKGWMEMNGEISDLDSSLFENAMNSMESSGMITDIDAEIFNYKQKGYTAKIDTVEIIDETPNWKISVTENGKQRFVFWVSQESFYTTKIAYMLSIGGNEQMMEVLFLEYKKLDEFIMPVLLEMKVMNMPIQMRITKFERLTAIDPKLFEKPKPKSEKAKSEQ